MTTTWKEAREELEDGREIHIRYEVSAYWAGTYDDPPEYPEVLQIEAWWMHGGLRGSRVIPKDLDDLIPGLEDKLLSYEDDDDDGEDW